MSPTKRRPRRYVREGEPFGRLKVLHLDTERTVYGKRYFWCQCSCGKKVSVYAPSLTNDNTTSCGCFRLERVSAAAKKRATHGESRGYRQTKAYRAYCNMVRRCYDPSVRSFPQYGGRGITVCARWLNDRATFFADMGDPPTPGHSVDRKRNADGYWCGKPDCSECGPAGREPNCRWATAEEQRLNRDCTRIIEHGGKRMTLMEWSRATGIKYRTLQARLDDFGWSVERTLTEPVHYRGNRKDLTC